FAPVSRVLALATCLAACGVIAPVVFTTAFGLVSAQEKVALQLATGFNLIKEDSLRADLTFVASDALQGRMSLQNGDDVAIAWIASEFAKAGLKPANGDSYLQAVPLVEYRGDRARSYIALKRGPKPEQQWKFPDAYGAYRADVDITAPVVFAGYGITA